MIRQTALPALRIGRDILLDAIAEASPRRDAPGVLVVLDPFWVDQRVSVRLLEQLQSGPGPVAVYSDFAGEPKASQVQAATLMGRDIDAGLVIGIGGGSSLDIAKLASACIASGESPEHYALGRHPVPARACDLVQVPTTAGTGSEANGTAVFADADGRKLWAHGPALKPCIAILDAALLASLPPSLKAWCGMDALVHAFEAGSNRWSNPVNLDHALHAIDLIVAALPPAVHGDPEADERLLLGSCLAGFAIENTGTSIAHCASHALARFAPVHHGLATALAFEITLPRVVATDHPALVPLAGACGATPATLPERVTGIMDSLGIERRLPAAFARVSREALASEMRSEANAPMCAAAPFDTGGDVLEGIAERLLRLAVTVESGS